MAVIVSHPRQTVATLMAFTAATAIISNALFLQAGQHPAPLFGTRSKTIAAPSEVPEPVALPRPRVIEAAPQTPPQQMSAPQSQLTPAAAPSRTPSRSQRNDPIAEMLSSRDTPVPPRDIPVAPASGSQRLIAVQRALSEFGYGQIKPTGTMGPDTQAAIERFERNRKLPVTGQLSDKMLRELAVATGRSFD